MPRKSPRRLSRKLAEEAALPYASVVVDKRGPRIAVGFGTQRRLMSLDFVLNIFEAAYSAALAQDRVANRRRIEARAARRKRRHTSKNRKTKRGSK